MTTSLTREIHSGIAVLTLNRPDQRNALNLELMRALTEALQEIATDDGIRVVVLRGNGPVFCAGHDLKEMRGDDSREAHKETFAVCAEVMMSIVRLPQPVIAQVHGVATAAGCQLVATCDLAVASDEARFATPSVRNGMFC